MEKIKIHYKEEDCQQRITQEIKKAFKNKSESKEIVIICVGTDRSTGDSLGPQIGKILKRKLNKHIHVYGTLEQPVHGQNLPEIYQEVIEKHPDSFTIAIDACLGLSTSVGCIQLVKGPLRPGAGVGRDDLPQIGDYHITGIVNVGGFMEYFVLQNTRLSLVIDLADKISDSIVKAFKGYRPKTPKLELAKEA
ncbi:germination protease [compost metagenome]